jgi:multiple antibiotic resistance protein
VEAIALAISALLPIMNPFSTAPLFVSLTADMDNGGGTSRPVGMHLRLRHSRRILLLGRVIIEFFGISIAGIRLRAA